MTYEIESKYRVDFKTYKNIIASLGAPKADKEALTNDFYFVKDKEYIRLRICCNNKDGKKVELTTKSTDDYTVRKEVNIKLNPEDPNLFNNVRNFLEMIGFTYKKHFIKITHIQTYEDCEMSFYRLFDENLVDIDSFMEVESLSRLNKETAKIIHKKFEDRIHKVYPDLNKHDKINASLFEMYVGTSK